MSKILFTQGNVACAEGAILAGCRFYAGYPITPSSEIAETMALKLPKVGGVYIQMEDEIGSLAAAIGASWTGVKAMTATSGPGFSLMQEHIGYAVMTETPVVIVNVQRGGPSTGQPTLASQGDMMQAKWGSHGDYQIIALAPSSVQECFDYTIKAFNLSEKYRVPAMIMSDEIIGHMREKLVIPDEIEVIDRKVGMNELPFKPDDDLVPKMPVFGKGYRVHVTGLTHDERGYPEASDPEVHYKLVKRLNDKILKNAKDIYDYTIWHEEDCSDAVVIAYGAPARSAEAAVKELREEGLSVGYVKLNVVWPFPDEVILKMAKNTELIVVPEMNLGQIVREVERASKGECEVKLIPKIGGELHYPEEIKRAVRGE
ncbi:2-oxoacid:acceptor oxidoreductase subunit alpha [Methanocaldococcus infernus]|uniref:2-oxoglutarate synthase subunit KorA n=1 Tax=Methanocaldococcus infernus (strain DSM 11812 / JCM 15783 / ME) TaxID=573063 RepID=D5VQA9_METIM|nr:2-oxoacid:acceptor oxidoreductase subunit alpha [Methanocaldococcus infernus]ADG12762.1 pyruvate flavodoxin/ferredoxin oxidoreductase domain protein [Methanocaldococcus infernus ME]